MFFQGVTIGGSFCEGHQNVKSSGKGFVVLAQKLDYVNALLRYDHGALGQGHDNQKRHCDGCNEPETRHDDLLIVLSTTKKTCDCQT